MPSSERSEAGEASGAESPHAAGEAFGMGGRGSTARRLGIWLVTRARLGVLLLCLGIVTLVLVTSENVVTEKVVGVFSSGHSSAAAVAASSPACAHERPPALVTVGAAQELELRAAVQSVTNSAGGQVYARGTVVPEDAWSDNEPAGGEVAQHVGSGSGTDAAGWPGSYEIRQWAPDPRWGASYRDDDAVDAFEFSTLTSASRFFDLATSVRCRRMASGGVARGAPGGRWLVWVNPDDATEEDVYVMRGRAVYRVVVVRPSGHEPWPSKAEDRAGVITAEALACGLPDAGCRLGSGRRRR